jgi:VanZ family protein
MRGLCPPGEGAWRRCRVRAVGLLVVGAVFAVGSEVYQELLPIRRAGDPYDAAADGAGLLAGILLYAAWLRVRGSFPGGREPDS